MKAYEFPVCNLLHQDSRAFPEEKREVSGGAVPRLRLALDSAYTTELERLSGCFEAEDNTCSDEGWND